MTFGPLEYVTIEFEGNHFTGEILPELRSLHERGVIRVVDLVLIQKAQDGTFTTRELSDLTGEEAKPFGPIAGDILTLLSSEDLEDVAATMENNSAAALALFEHTWAVRLKETIANAHGKVTSAGLVSPSAVESWATELETADTALHA
ncbi:MAG TPA: DUF6325 family protein [Ktedonobacterales bacterium]|nr:DUF6325 family protein [Ktedonobacterales bacterium]